MDMKKYFKSVVKGTIGATLLTLLLLLILSLLMMKFEFSTIIYNWAYTGVSVFSLALGAIIAAFINEEKGWLVGLNVAFFYYLLFLVITSVMFGGVEITSLLFMKFLLNLVVGILGGMVGINL
ncbi:MAG: TIGR04086 family membrane protein [Clostridium sp.]